MKAALRLRLCVARTRAIALPAVALSSLLALSNIHPNSAPADADLIFSSNHEGNSEIYLWPAAEDRPRNLTLHKEGDNWPVPSPDGSRIAFQSSRNGKLDVYVMNRDGNELRRITTDPAHDYVPSWSPDGQTLYFLSWRQEQYDAKPAPHFYRVTLAGGKPARVNQASPQVSGGIAVSPDGETFSYVRKGSDGELELVLADSSLRATEVIAKSGVGAPAFSPDGRRLVWHQEAGGRVEIRLIDLSSGKQSIVLDKGRNWYPRFSSDGRRLVVSRSDESDADIDIGYVVIDRPGEFRPLVLTAARSAEASWLP